MKPLSEHLTVLVATAEDIMRRPAQIPTQLPLALVDLGAEIRMADARPAEGVRSTRAGIMMVNAIEGFFEHGDDRWQILIGATLPVLRREAWQALRSERTVSGESKR